jgi:hypothetical protein
MPTTPPRPCAPSSRAPSGTLSWSTPTTLGLLPADPDDGDEAGHGLLAQAQADFGPAFARWNAPFLT